MKTCWMYGCDPRATRPMAAASMGVSRQPSTVRPSSRTIRSITPSHCKRRCCSTGRNVIPTPYSPAGGRVKPRLAALARKKPVRNLDQHAGAVAGFRIAAARPAVGQVDEYLDAFVDDVVRFLAFYVRNEPDSTRIMFVPWVV